MRRLWDWPNTLLNYIAFVSVHKLILEASCDKITKKGFLRMFSSLRNLRHIELST